MLNHFVQVSADKKIDDVAKQEESEQKKEATDSEEKAGKPEDGAPASKVDGSLLKDVVQAMSQVEIGELPDILDEKKLIKK